MDDTIAARIVGVAFATLFLTTRQTALLADQPPVRPPWPPAAGVVSSLEMLTPRWQTVIAPVKVDGIQWGGAVYPGDLGTGKADRLARAIARVHAAGAMYIGSINGAGFYHRTMNDEAIVFFDGTLRHRRDSKAIVYKCWLRPKMYRAFVETAKRCVDLGMDGFVLDDWSASNQLCFCDECLALYREYLRQHKDDPAVQRLLGNADIDTFDYGRYLRDQQVDRTLPDWKLPLGWQLKHYRRDKLLQRVCSFWQTIRHYANHKGERPFYLTANVYSMPWMAFAVRDRLDYFLVETGYFHVYGGYPPRGASIALHKKTRMAGKRGVLQPANVDTIRRLLGKPSVATLYKIWIAEAYASGNLFQYLPRTHGGIQIEGDSGTRFLDLPVRQLRPYYAFIQQHGEIYTDTTSPARIGVLYHMTEAVDKEFLAVCKLLYDAHYQFDAVLIGDGAWDKTVPTAELLAKYKVLFLPLAKTPLPEVALEQLARYRQGGGLLVPSTEFARFHRSKQAAGFAPFWKCTTGRRTPPSQLHCFTPYLQTLDATTRDQVRNLIGTDPVLQTSAPPTVGIQCWQAGSRTMVHFVNYDYHEQADQVDPVQGIQVRVCTAAQRARWFSPDDGTAMPLPLEREGNSVAFTLPRLGVYGIVVLER